MSLFDLTQSASFGSMCQRKASDIIFAHSASQKTKGPLSIQANLHQMIRELFFSCTSLRHRYNRCPLVSFWLEDYKFYYSFMRIADLSYNIIRHYLMMIDPNLIDIENLMPIIRLQVLGVAQPKISVPFGLFRKSGDTFEEGAVYNPSPLVHIL